jgi:hypothetical protein
MNMKRKVYTIGAGLIAACMAAATASAQTYMVYEYGASAGAVSQVSVTNLAPNWVATGVRNGGGDLELITWESTGTALVRKGSATTGAINNAGMATVALSPTRVITAVVDPYALVELTSWSVSSAGAVTVGSSMPGEYAKNVRMAKLDSNRVVTAVEDAGGELYVSVWSVSSSGAITEESSTGGFSGATMVSLAAMSNSQVVTAICTSAGDLELDSWNISPTNAITHQHTNSAGAIFAVDITAWADAGHVATPVSNGSSKLEVIDWVVNPTTGAITRQSSATVGGAGIVAATTIGTLVFTAVQNSVGKVDAGVWGYSGSQIGQGASAKQEAITAVAAAPLSTGPYSVTATVTTAGDLKVDVWNYFSIQ